MFFSKSMAGGRHVGPPGETPKSPQSPEHVFGPEENKGTTVDTTRNDAKLLFPSNFKHLSNSLSTFLSKVEAIGIEAKSSWNKFPSCLRFKFT